MTNLLARLFRRSVTMGTRTIKMANNSLHIIMSYISAILRIFKKPVLVMRPIFRPTGRVTKLGRNPSASAATSISTLLNMYINISCIHINYRIFHLGIQGSVCLYRLVSQDIYSTCNYGIIFTIKGKKRRQL